MRFLFGKGRKGEGVGIAVAELKDKSRRPIGHNRGASKRVT